MSTDVQCFIFLKGVWFLTDSWLQIGILCLWFCLEEYKLFKAVCTSGQEPLVPKATVYHPPSASLPLDFSSTGTQQQPAV
jgi:hypothetical protein